MYVCILDGAGQVLVHSVRKSIEVDVALIDQYDALVNDLELTIVREAKRHDGDAFHRLRSVPGIGKVLALTILYEIHDIARFDRVQEFASYARLIKCRKDHKRRCELVHHLHAGPRGGDEQPDQTHHER